MFDTIRHIGFDISIRFVWTEWPFIKIRVGKIHQVCTPHGAGESHEIFPDV